MRNRRQQLAVPAFTSSRSLTTPPRSCAFSTVRERIPSSTMTADRPVVSQPNSPPGGSSIRYRPAWMGPPVEHAGRNCGKSRRRDGRQRQRPPLADSSPADVQNLDAVGELGRSKRQPGDTPGVRRNRRDPGDQAFAAGVHRNNVDFCSRECLAKGAHLLDQPIDRLPVFCTHRVRVIDEIVGDERLQPDVLLTGQRPIELGVEEIAG